MTQEQRKLVRACLAVLALLSVAVPMAGWLEQPRLIGALVLAMVPVTLLMVLLGVYLEAWRFCMVLRAFRQAPSSAPGA
jgi:hypothetical protein